MKIDNYGVVENCAESALDVRRLLMKNQTVAISLHLGNMTQLNMSFVPLWIAIPEDVSYFDGSNKGIQINIDRMSSYALSMGSEVNEWSYIKEKWDLGKADAEKFLPFLNTVLSGKDCYGS
jgi:hypothetical protein